MSRGGARVGAGKKPLSAALGALHGHHPRPLLELLGDDPPPLPAPVDPPLSFTLEEQLVWRELAPAARHERTLTGATAAGFALLVRAVVLERALSADPKTRGRSDHRGLMQRCESGFARYRLAPTGRPVALPPAPVDPFAEFTTPAGRPQ